MPQYQRRRYQKDEALGDPEDCENLEEETTHGSALRFQLRTVYEELIPCSANSLYPVAARTDFIQLAAKPAHMHVEAAVEGAQTATQCALSQLLS